MTENKSSSPRKRGPSGVQTKTMDSRVRGNDGAFREIVSHIDAMPSLEERLARFDPARHGGEVMAGKALGAERWQCRLKAPRYSSSRK
ncbi:MAG: PbsX family transcriptional regulator [Rhodocyclales bacterium]|nr:PbsX family transcriptional regulator [Rhodocyclales bacterium]